LTVETSSPLPQRNLLKVGPIYLRAPFRSPFVRAAAEELPPPTYWLGDDEVLKRYGDGLGRAILALKRSVGRQKRKVEGRWRSARRWMFCLSGAVLVTSTIGAVFGGLTATSQGEVVGMLRVALPAIIALLTGSEALLDTRGRYVREAQAQLKLTRLQSDIEYALVWDDKPATVGISEPYRSVTFATLERWKEVLDSILDTVSSEYIAANSKAAERKR